METQNPAYNAKECGAENEIENPPPESVLTKLSLPGSVYRFWKENELKQYQSDEEYMEGVIACEELRHLLMQIQSQMQKSVQDYDYSRVAKKIWLLEEGELFQRGTRRVDVLRSLLIKLDEKLARKRDQMKSPPPVLEAFLDRMGATDLERRALRYTVVCQATMDEVVSLNLLARVLALPHKDLVPVDDLTSMFKSKDSPWVQEGIFKPFSSPNENLCTLKSLSLGALMGSRNEVTAARFHTIASPKLQEVLMAEGSRFLNSPVGQAILQSRKQPDVSTSDDAKRDGTLAPSVFVQTIQKQDERVNKGGSGPPLKRDRLFDAMHAALESEKATKRVKGNDVSSGLVDLATTEKTAGNSNAADAKEDIEAREASINFGPYESDIDYLEDQVELARHRMAALFCNQWQSLTNRSESGNLEGLEEDNEYWAEEEISNLETELRDYDSEGSEDMEEEIDQAGGNFHRLKLMQQNLEGFRDRVSAKIQASRVQLKREFRLEQLCSALKLGEFEKYCILCLVASVLIPSAGLQASGGRVSVGNLIDRFCYTLEEKMTRIKAFYKSSLLIKEGILMLHQTDFMTDLRRCQVELDRRLFDFLVGLDSEMSEMVDGSHLYVPDVELDDVILPAATKKQISDIALSHDKVKDAIHEHEIDQKITYGLGQIILFYGHSGTGKTMCANALATKLNLKVLLINFPSFGQNSSGEAIKFIFREAKIKRALLFFDECESLFMTREKGGSSINMLLTELERFDGMCILATNRAFDLDEAMHRRISLAIEFRKPDHYLREEIWMSLKPPKLPLDNDIKFSLLARKFELTGGLIKNAWLQAVGYMIQRGGVSVNEEDLAQAASEQIMGHIGREKFDRRVVPTCGTESVIVTDAVKEALITIVHHTKAQSVLFGQWGFEKMHRSTTGMAAMFTGSPGTGKTMAAEAIAFDLGRPILVVNVAELVSQWVGESGKNIEAVFNDAKSKEAVLVFDEAEALFGTRSSGSSGDGASRHDTLNVGILLQYIETFPGVCIVITNMKDAIDEAFFRRFRFVVDFEKPQLELRERIWASLIPPECPLDDKVSFRELAQRFDGMAGGDIKSAVLRAATRAALRQDGSQSSLTMEDLTWACQAERDKVNGNLSHPFMYT